MTILELIIVIAVLGFCAWVVQQIDQIPPQFKKLILLVLLIAAVLVLVSGVLGVDVLGVLRRPLR